MQDPNELALPDHLVLHHCSEEATAGQATGGVLADRVRVDPVDVI
jgi:hypothetical protein